MSAAPPMVDLDRAELEARLREAEETLRAIREGEVDALVVQGGRADRVFTLEDNAQSYRAFMEAMDLGAAAFDDAGRLLYANQALCGLLDTSSAELLSGGFWDVFDVVGRATIRRLFASATHDRVSAEVSLHPAGGQKSLLLTAAPLLLGVTDGLAVTFTDLTEREQAAAIEESERLARAVLASANEAVVVCDADGLVTHMNGAAQKICLPDAIGRRFGEVIALTFGQATQLMGADDIVQMATAGAPVRGLDAAITQAVEVTDLLVSAAPLAVVGDRVRGCVVTLVDVSAQKAAERQQHLLMGELDHRVKNTLSLVLAISTRTARHETTIAGFQKAFTGRVQALAATHTLLADKSWSALRVEDLLRAELAAYAAENSTRVATSGLDFEVRSQAAIALGMVFHELVTNAVKYGALSMPSGRLEVRRTTADDEMRFVAIEWVELDGPAVIEPETFGFGQTVISKSLAFAPGGQAAVEFLPTGVVCRLKVPMG